MAVGKISGAGRHASHLGTKWKDRICKRLGLSVVPVASQVIHATATRYFSAPSRSSRHARKIALEIRICSARSREAKSRQRQQRGSSAMPHKRNPVTCEQICGLARLVRSNMLAAFENVALWTSATFPQFRRTRILPDSTILVDYMLFENVRHPWQMRVFPERMMRNLDPPRPRLLGQLLQDLVEKGIAPG